MFRRVGTTYRKCRAGRTDHQSGADVPEPTPDFFDRAGQAAELAAVYRLRGADAVYLAVAEEFGTTLVTWDGEMHTRGANVVTAVTPAEWLTAQTGSGN